ncbi:MAG: PA14 domain-containing protein, partial [Nostoc sp.]|uniref:PA14 domain-containing protein n=1 Tax=Nostoc sp. TaxID=1180 RepID=UPI002FFC8704
MNDSQDLNQQSSASASVIGTPSSSLQSIDSTLFNNARSSASAVSQGDGLKAEYYDNIDFSKLKVTRTDPTVNFNWDYGSPDPTVGVDTFSAR